LDLGIIGVELKVVPLEFLHPETIEMDGANWDLAVLHALNKRAGGLEIVTGGETG
jgi:hypothetical protein